MKDCIITLPSLFTLQNFCKVLYSFCLLLCKFGCYFAKFLQNMLLSLFAGSFV